MSHASVLIALTPKSVAQLGLEAAVAEQMYPFDENDECFRDGSRWDWYQVGGRYSGKFIDTDIIQVKDINLKTLAQHRRKELTECWREAAADKHTGDRHLIYGVDPDEELLDNYLQRTCDGVQFPSSYAFLHDRHWHEAERLGWFGTSTYTECEREAKRKGSPSIEEMIRRCKYRDEETGAVVVCWNEPWEVWNKEFYHRFVQPLSPETTLVNVDYHV